MKSALAKARDKWFVSDDGKKCCHGTATGQYLHNCLERAFLAGANFSSERIKELKNRLLEHLKGHSLEAVCDECASHYWYVDDEPITCPFCNPEQALKD